jgi:sec-independent protein translocase protein TatB
MFDLGWAEMAIIMMIALIVIGPKDLPKVARTVGRWVAKGRALAREFQNQLEDMARETELDEVKREIERAGRTDLKRTVAKTIDPEGELDRAFDPDDGKGKAKAKTDKSEAKGANGAPKSKSAAARTAQAKVAGRKAEPPAAPPEAPPAEPAAAKPNGAEREKAPAEPG